MNISLPENLKEFVHSRVKAGGFSSASDMFATWSGRIKSDKPRRTWKPSFSRRLDRVQGVSSRRLIGKRSAASLLKRLAKRPEMSFRVVVRSSAETDLLESATVHR